MREYEDTVAPERAPCDLCGRMTEEFDADLSNGGWVCEECASSPCFV